MKHKEIRKMNSKEKEEKLKELKTELLKTNASKGGSSRIKEIKKMIARILTLNK